MQTHLLAAHPDHPPAEVSRIEARVIGRDALTDSALSPLAGGTAASFTASVTGAGPFDSHVGLLALANALLAGVAARLRRSATDRLDQVEAAWRAADALTDG